MGTAKKNDLEHTIDEALNELEAVTDEIRVKLHLAGMDANDLWDKKLAPRLEEARAHAKEAKVASKKVIDDTVRAFREFAGSL
jgi:hypothetical protein